MRPFDRQAQAELAANIERTRERARQRTARANEQAALPSAAAPAPAASLAPVASPEPARAAPAPASRRSRSPASQAAGERPAQRARLEPEDEEEDEPPPPPSYYAERAATNAHSPGHGASAADAAPSEWHSTVWTSPPAFAPGAPLELPVERGITAQRASSTAAERARRDPALRQQYATPLRDRRNEAPNPSAAICDKLDLPSDHPLRQKVSLGRHIVRVFCKGVGNPDTIQQEAAYRSTTFRDVLVRWEDDRDLSPGDYYRISEQFETPAQYWALISRGPPPAPGAAAAAPAAAAAVDDDEEDEQAEPNPLDELGRGALEQDSVDLSAPAADEAVPIVLDTPRAPASVAVTLSSPVLPHLPPRGPLSVVGVVGVSPTPLPPAAAPTPATTVSSPFVNIPPTPEPSGAGSQQASVVLSCTPSPAAPILPPIGAQAPAVRSPPILPPIDPSNHHVKEEERRA